MKHLTLIACFVTFLAFKSSAQTPSPADTIVWGSIQKNFPGGQDAYSQFVTDHALYPEVALVNHTMGSVYLTLIIEKDGSISNLKVVHDIGGQMDEAASNLVSHSGKWIPTLINGQPVRTLCYVPVNYIISTNHNHAVFGVINGLPPETAFTSVPIAPNCFIVLPPQIALKDAKTYLGLKVTIKDVVYSHRKIDNTEVLYLGGQHPNELVAVILSDSAFETYKNKNLDGKTMSFTGTPEVKNGGYQLSINNPNYIHINPH